jgi:hypothetical protein
MRNLILGVAWILAGCGDFSPLSGGELTGPVQPVPSDWGIVASDDIVQLETRAPDPYTVNLWVIGRGSELYVFAGDNRAAWVEYMAANPEVRLKMSDAIYELTSERVTDPAEFEIFAQAWAAKYGNRPQNENVDETYLMKLAARP